jgi:hypothetical protein
MEDDLKKMEDDILLLNGGNFNLKKIEDYLDFFQMEDDLNIFLNGRRPHFF